MIPDCPYDIQSSLDKLVSSPFRHARSEGQTIQAISFSAHSFEDRQVAKLTIGRASLVPFSTANSLCCGEVSLRHGNQALGTVQQLHGPHDHERDEEDTRKRSGGENQATSVGRSGRMGPTNL